jgi:hypothetical protein
LIVDQLPKPDIIRFTDEDQQLPVIESTPGYTEDKLRGFALCNFPLLDKKEPTFKLNVDKFKDEDGNPYQISPMGRLLAFGAIGSVLFRAIKDCRDEFLHPNGQKKESFKLTVPGEITFNSSDIELSAISSLSAPKPVPTTTAPGHVSPFSTEKLTETIDQKTVKPTSVFNNIDIKPKPDVVNSQDNKVEAKINLPKGLNIGSIPPINKDKEFSSGTIDEKKPQFEASGMNKSPSTTKLIANMNIGVTLPKTNPIPTIVTPPVPESKVINPLPKPAEDKKTETKPTKPAEAPAKEVPKPEPIKIEPPKTVEETLNRLKMDSELKKLVDTNKNFDNLMGTFRALDLTLKKRPTLDRSLKGEIPADLWKSTVNSAVSSLKAEKDQISACRDQVLGLRQVWHDTGSVTRLVLGKGDPKTKGAKILSAAEDLDMRNEARLQGLKRHVDGLLKVDVCLRRLLAAVKTQSLAEPKAVQEPKDAPTLGSSKTSSKISEEKPPIVQNKPISMFGGTNNKTLFGPKPTARTTHAPNWDLLKTSQQNSRGGVDSSLKTIQGTMIDRIKSDRKSSIGKGVSQKDEQIHQKIPSMVSKGFLSSSSNNNSTKRTDLQDFLSTYFRLKENEIDQFEKKISSITAKSAKKSGVSINLDFLDESYSEKISVRSSSGTGESLNTSLLRQDGPQSLNVERQLKDFETLVRKRVKMHHCFDLSLRKQLVDEAEREQARLNKSYQEQVDKEKQLQASKQAASAAAQKKPQPPQTAGQMQEKKVPDSGLFPTAAAPKPEAKPEAKPETVGKTPATAALGGIFGEKSKPNAEGDKEVKVEPKVVTSTLLGKDSKEQSGGLFGNKSEGPESKKSDIGFGSLKDSKDAVPKASAESKTGGLFDTKGTIGNKVGDASKPDTGLFGGFTAKTEGKNIPEKKSELDFGKTRVAPTIQSSGSQSDDEDEDGPPELGGSLKHSVSQIGDSKAGSRQTENLSKKDSELFQGISENKPKVESPIAPKTKQEGKTLFDTKISESSNPIQGSLFSTKDQKEPPKFTNLSDPSKQTNIFGGMQSKIGDSLFGDNITSKNDTNSLEGLQKGSPKPEIEKKSDKAEPLFSTNIFNAPQTNPQTSTSNQSTYGMFTKQDTKPPQTGNNEEKPENKSAGISAGGLFGTGSGLGGASTQGTQGGLFAGAPSTGLFLNTGTNSNTSQLNLGGEGFKTLFSTTPQSTQKVAFGQTATLGGTSMGSTGFGGGSASISPINFGGGFTQGIRQPRSADRPECIYGGKLRWN